MADDRDLINFAYAKLDERLQRIERLVEGILELTVAWDKMTDMEDTSFLFREKRDELFKIWREMTEE